MARNRNIYQSPLASRYASSEMLHIFSEQYKFVTWRTLWVALAEAERKLGLPISRAQIKELKKYRDSVNYAVAEKFERQTRHDVMAHVKAYGTQCRHAAGIIHLGATSAYVGDNTDLIQLREAALLIRKGLVDVIAGLAAFARKYARMPALGYTHYQPAQPVTVGKRACLWIQDLLSDVSDLDHFIQNLKFLGVKGTTGTQASFMELFNGSEVKVKKLDALVTRHMGFSSSFPVAGQTYPRKVDGRILAILSGIAQSAHKFACDLRLLQHDGEVEEPFGNAQVGSSAMAYKRNPMRSERICSLARFVMSLEQGTAFTAATQWFERTLDDSANKRLAIPEAFLAADAILIIYRNIAAGMVVHPEVIQRRLARELPFMATENILMEAVKRGGDRQRLHELIRTLSMEARQDMLAGKPCRLLERMAGSGAFRLSGKEMDTLARPSRFIGRAPSQTNEFLKTTVAPVLKRSRTHSTSPVDLKV